MSEPLDFFRTPAWTVRAIMPHLPIGTVLDPCAGDGAIVRAVIASGVAPELVDGIEINEALATKCREWASELECADALAMPWAPHQLVILNPPFSKAQEFVEHAIEQQRAHRGTVAALLRLGFLASMKRVPFWKANTGDVYVLPKRPAFIGNKSDASEYAWFVFGPGRGGRWSVLELDGQ